MSSRNWTPGPPPPDSPWRCGFTLATGRRCRAWSLATPETRNQHTSTGLRRPLGLCRIHNRWADSGHLWGLANVSNFYRRALGPTLLAAMEDQLSQSQPEQVSVTQELALMRAGSHEAVRLHAEAVEVVRIAEGTGDPAHIQAARDILATTAHEMMSQLERVTDVVIKQARIEASLLGKDGVTAHSLYSVVSQVTRIFYVVCGEEHEGLARMVEEKIKNEVRMPGAGSAEGTDIRPGDAVTAMNLSIPTEPPEE